MTDMVHNLSAANRENAYKIARVKFEEQTVYRTQKEKIKQKAALKHEKARLEFKRQEAEAQRAHKLTMMERQFNMERARTLGFQAGHIPSMFSSTQSQAPGSSHTHAYTPSQPPPSWGIDPNM
jgi:hypothetical protein